MKTKQITGSFLGVLCIALCALILCGTDPAWARLPKDLTGYRLAELKSGSEADLARMAQGKAMVLVFSTPT